MTQPPWTTAWCLKQGIRGHCGLEKRQSNDCFQSGVTWKQALTDQGRFCFVVGLQQRVMGRGRHSGGEGSKLEQSHTSQDNLTRAIKQSSSLTSTHTRTHIHTHVHGPVWSPEADIIKVVLESPEGSKEISVAILFWEGERKLRLSYCSWIRRSGSCLSWTKSNNLA